MVKDFAKWLAERQKQKVSSILSEKLKSKTKVHVYDFDSTLFATHEPEEGKKLHKDLTGKDWQHKGWWGRPETLDEPLASQIQPNPEVVAAFKRSKADPTVLTVLLTGRHDDTLEKDSSGNFIPKKNPRMVPNIHSLLLRHGLIPDIDIYKTGRLDTYEFKIATLEKMLPPNIQEIEIWEDRHDHVWGGKNEGFMKFLSKVKVKHNLSRVVLHHVVNGSVTSYEI